MKQILFVLLLIAGSLSAKNYDTRHDTLVRNDSASAGLLYNGTNYTLFYHHDFTALLGIFKGGTLTRPSDVLTGYFPAGVYSVDSIWYDPLKDYTHVLFSGQTGVNGIEWDAPMHCTYYIVKDYPDPGPTLTAYQQIRPEVMQEIDTFHYRSISVYGNKTDSTITLNDSTSVGMDQFSLPIRGIYYNGDSSTTISKFIGGTVTVSTSSYEFSLPAITYTVDSFTYNPGKDQTFVWINRQDTLTTPTSWAAGSVHCLYSKMTTTTTGCLTIKPGASLRIDSIAQSVNPVGVLGIDSVGKVGIIVGYRVYSVLVTQSGESDPTIVVLQNTLGGVPVWTRTSSGVYTCALAGIWSDPDKFAFIGGTDYSYSGGTKKMCFDPGSSDTDNIVVAAINREDSASDGVSRVFVEFRVYR